MKNEFYASFPRSLGRPTKYLEQVLKDSPRTVAIPGSASKQLPNPVILVKARTWRSVDPKEQGEETRNFIFFDWKRKHTTP